jgi:hypothetical protein
VRAHPNLLLKLAVAGALSLAVIELVPRSADSSGSEPPVRTLLVTAVLIGLFCVVALLWGMLVDLRLPAKVAVLAVAFNALVILVKFVLAPRGFYDVNQTRDLDSTFSIDNELMAFMAAALIFVLYFAAYVVLYRLFAAASSTCASATRWRESPRGGSSSSSSSCSPCSSPAREARSCWS